MNYNFSNKTVLITGASRGIGKALVTEFGKCKAFVIGTATSEKGIQSIKQNLTQNNIEGTAYLMNLENRESIENLHSQLQNNNQLPNIIINNAGLTGDNLFLRMNEDLWLKVINANLNGTYRVIKSFIKDLVKARWGRIINISSVIGSTGNAGQVNYSASKSALSGLTKSLAIEFASRNITVNNIAPGFIQTDMTDMLDDTTKDEISKKIPLARLGTVEDIANCALFLADDNASYITGQTIHVNGGMYMN